MTPSNVIWSESLSLAYTPSAPVLIDANLCLQQGEYLGLSGASGSGKTTLLRTLAGLYGLEPGLRAEGRLRAVQSAQSCDLLRESKLRFSFRQNQVAMVTESARSAFHPQRTIHKQWQRFFPKLKLATRLEAMGIVEPERIMNAYSYQLSGGEAQRVQLAFALAKEAPILLCESPTLGLDVLNASIIIQHLEGLRTEGRTVVHVDHNAALLDRLSSRRLHLEDRTLHEAGKTSATALYQLPAALQQNPPRPIETLLDAKDVQIKFGNFAAVAGVSLQLMAGEIVVLTGISGSGKTSLAKALARVQVAAGRLALCGREVGFAERPFDSPEPSIQYVYQDGRSSLNPQFTVLRTLREHGAASDDEALELLELMGLSSELASRSVLTLSTGQMQRLVLARALATKGKILVCDEITSALDPENEARVIRALQQIRVQQSVAVLYITHDLALAQKVADRVLVMEQGKIVEDSSAQQFFRSPSSPHGKELLALSHLPSS